MLILISSSSSRFFSPRSVFLASCSFFPFLKNFFSLSPQSAQIGRIAPLVDSPVGMEGFRDKYHMLQGVACSTMFQIKCLPIGMRGSGHSHDCLHRRGDDTSHKQGNPRLFDHLQAVPSPMCTQSLQDSGQCRCSQ